MGNCGYSRVQDPDGDSVTHEYNVTGIAFNPQLQGEKTLPGHIIMSPSALKVASGNKNVIFRWGEIHRMIWNGQLQLVFEVGQSESGISSCSFTCKNASIVYLKAGKYLRCYRESACEQLGSAGPVCTSKLNGSSSPQAVTEAPTESSTCFSPHHVDEATKTDSVHLGSEQTFQTSHKYVNLTPYSNLSLPAPLCSARDLKLESTATVHTKEGQLESDDVFLQASGSGEVESAAVPTGMLQDRMCSRRGRCRSVDNPNHTTPPISVRRKSTGTTITYTPVVFEEILHASGNAEAMKVSYNKVDFTMTKALNRLKTQRQKERSLNMDQRRGTFGNKFTNSPDLPN